MAESKEKPLGGLRPRGVDECLVVVLQPTLVFATLGACPKDGFYFRGKRYHDRGYGSFTGFYDWIRDSAQKIIGLRYWPFEETVFILEKLAHWSRAVRAQDESYLEIYFASGQNVDWQHSDDQDFGSNQFFSTDDDEWAISFAIKRLDDREVDDIYTAAVHLDNSGGSDHSRAT